MKNLKFISLFLFTTVLLVSSGYFYYENTSLKTKLSDMLTRYQVLQSEVDKLGKEKSDLMKLYNDLLVEYRSLNESYYRFLSETNFSRIILLPDDEYFSVVKSLIEHANKSVYIAIYVVKFDVGSLMFLLTSFSMH